MTIDDALGVFQNREAPLIERWAAYHHIRKFGNEYDQFMLDQAMTIDTPLKDGQVLTRVIGLANSLKLEEPFTFFLRKNMDLEISVEEIKTKYLVLKTDVQFNPDGTPSLVEAIVTPQPDETSSDLSES